MYVADTWNKRIQVLIPEGDSLSFPTNITWDIEAWYGESLDNKPFLAIDDANNTYVADPVMGRVLVFDQQGNFLATFGAFGSGPAEIGTVGGLAVNADGNVWVSDARNNRLMLFNLPDLPLAGPFEDNQDAPPNNGNGESPEGLFDEGSPK